MTTDPQDRNRIGQLELEVARLKNMVAFMMQELKLTYQEPPENAFDAQVRTLVEQNRAMDAIRLYRETKGASLTEAKTYIDQLTKGPR